MTPKPDNLPKDPADMTLSQVLQECARILHNAGGAERGAEYSAELADAALRWAENLPGWKPIEAAPRDGTWFWGLVDEDAISMRFDADFSAFVSSWREMTFSEKYGGGTRKHSPTIHAPDYWMSTPPAPEGGE